VLLPPALHVSAFAVGTSSIPARASSVSAPMSFLKFIAGFTSMNKFDESKTPERTW
jgi:hypothetical protein